MTIKYSRSDYMGDKCSHIEYYSQFVTPEIKGIVSSRFGDILNKSEDPHFNDIPLRFWEIVLMPTGTNARLKEAGDYLTSAGKVCILKEAARQIKHNMKN